ncbi:MAG: hypothetical protein M3252_06435 [Actinomycetota bacterium]|nr:hypothetical protein [Actinomycetota bacterium]
MRRTVLLVSVLVAAVTPVMPSLAYEEPPRGPCNQGTVHAHGTVPHETEGNMVAHDHIPHCPHH